MSPQDEFRQALPSEAELVAADLRIAHEGETGTVPQKCPTRAQLMLFVAGRYSERRVATISDHLAECDSCTAVLGEMRSHQKFAERRTFSRNKLVLAAVAVAVLIAATLALWLIRGGAASETATADLRNVTRGLDASPDSGVVLNRNTRRVRILLTPQPFEAQYQIAVFNPTDRSSPVLISAASSTRQSGSLVLEAPLAIRNLQPGAYLLGIRHDQSEWVYYSIRIE